MSAAVLNTTQLPLTRCCGMPTARLSLDNDSLPRCTGCGHRQADPDTGARPVQTRERGPVAWATEMPSRWRAQRIGRAL